MSYRLFRTDRQGRQFQNVRSQVAQKTGLAEQHLLDLRKRRKMYGHWRQGQTTWEEYRDAGHHCRDKILVAKT